MAFAAADSQHVKLSRAYAAPSALARAPRAGGAAPCASARSRANTSRGTVHTRGPLAFPTRGSGGSGGTTCRSSGGDSGGASGSKAPRPRPPQPPAPAGGSRLASGALGGRAAGGRAGSRAERRGGRGPAPQPTSDDGNDGGDGEDGDGDDVRDDERAADFGDILPQERVSAREAERLIFGGKDFTKGAPPPGASQAELAEQCAAALQSIGLPPSAAATLMALRAAGKAPSEPEAFTARASAACDAAGGPERLEPAFASLAASLSLPDAGWELPVMEAAAAAVSALRVLSMPPAAVAARLAELEDMLKVGPARVRQLAARSPALLLAPSPALRERLSAMSAATTLDLEACAMMLTVHMFPGVRM
ncbi:hypothetical protein FOA52_014907 [Chlamydomonas sp. UWO 241]|nr:hypothetical protein FOA52_014907 [Chlamydomonas sp. UWO 241]